jgi:hypothetical protein
VAIGLTDNNPGDLLVSGNVINWQGETGTVSVGPYTYYSFDTVADGIRALAIDLTTAINNGANTVSALVYHFLGTSANNTANPAVSNYLSAVSQGSGLSTNQTITTANVPQLVQGILNAEGTASGTSQADINMGLQEAGYSGVSGMSPAQTVLTSAVNNGLNNFGTGLNELFTNPLQFASIYGGILSNGVQAIVSNPGATASGLATNAGTGAAVVGTAAANTATQATQAAAAAAQATTNFFTSITKWLQGISTRSFVTRVALVILGMLLIAAAIFAFTRPNLSLPNNVTLAIAP